MPTIANSLIPAPNDWNEFEEIVASCLRIRWMNKNISRIGRKGQTQHGVDIYGEDDAGRRAGVQCKLSKVKLNYNDINNEVLKAEEFLPKLDIYYIATTAQRDATLQEKINKLTEERKTNSKFPIQLLFWEDLVQDLVTDHAELIKHYPEINLNKSMEKEENKKHFSKKGIILSSIFLFIILLYLLEPAGIKSAMSSSSLILFENKWGITIFLILLGFTLTVLRISDKKFKKEMEDYYQPKRFESTEKNLSLLQC